MEGYEVMDAGFAFLEMPLGYDELLPDRKFQECLVVKHGNTRYPTHFDANLYQYALVQDVYDEVCNSCYLHCLLSSYFFVNLHIAKLALQGLSLSILSY